MWDNFARLTALLAKVRVWLNNSTIYLDFSAIFSEIALSKLITKGRHYGALFCRRGGAILAKPPMLRHWSVGQFLGQIKQPVASENF